MAIASNTSDSKKLNVEKGVKMPRTTSSMNKLPPMDLTTNEKAKSSTESLSKKELQKQIDDDAKIIGTAKKRFSSVIKSESDNRKEGLEDLKFLNNDQWSQADASARATDGRPCITENRLPTFANQITNDQRQNRPAIVISPMGDKASKKDAKLLRGMIRAIERDSSADVAYDIGFQSAVHNGWGYWRVMTAFESNSSFNRVIEIKPISNPMTVYLDPNRSPFELDAKWGFVSEMLPRDEFEREYPESSTTPWGEAGTGDQDKDWVTEDTVRVAEYYYFEYEERELILLDNGHQGWEDELADEIKQQISSKKLSIIDQRTVQVMKLKWCKMTAIEILDFRDCDGDYIPIIECDGTVLNINGKVTKKGIVRDAKGPQRMLNYYATLETENVALQPKAPWVMEEGQIEGHEDKWEQANKKSYSYLLYRGISLGGKPAPPPQRQAFAGPPAAILAAKQGQVEALRAVTGIRFDATMSERMQDESGKAIRELNNNANLGSYHYIDNYARALRNTGIILCNLIPAVYDTKRIVSILDESGSEAQIQIDPNMQQAHKEVRGNTPTTQNDKIKVFNPKIGRYQVTVTIGPSYATKRIEATESQMDFARAFPAISGSIADLIAKNSDWEGSEEIANRLAKTIPANLLAPSRDDMSPQVQSLIQGLQTEIQQQKMQMMQMMKDLTDRQKDRDVVLTQIEAKQHTDIMKIAAHFQEEMEKTAAKRESTMHGIVGRQLADVAKAIQGFEQLSKQNMQQPLPVEEKPGQQQTQQTPPAGMPG